MIKPSDKSSYTNVVDTIDEMEIVGIVSYAIEGITTKEVEIMKGRDILTSLAIIEFAFIADNPNRNYYPYMFMEGHGFNLEIEKTSRLRCFREDRNQWHWRLCGEEKGQT